VSASTEPLDAVAVAVAVAVEPAAKDAPAVGRTTNDAATSSSPQRSTPLSQGLVSALSAPAPPAVP
jgi:hypothetical protein